MGEQNTTRLGKEARRYIDERLHSYYAALMSRALEDSEAFRERLEQTMETADRRSAPSDPAGKAAP